MAPNPSALTNKHASKKVQWLGMAAVSIAEDEETDVVTTDPKTTSTSSTNSATGSTLISSISSDSLNTSATNNSGKISKTTNAGGDHGAERSLESKRKTGSKKKNQRRRQAVKKKIKENVLLLDIAITPQNTTFTSISTFTSTFTSNELDTARQSTDGGAELVELPTCLEIEKDIQATRSLEGSKTPSRDAHAQNPNNTHPDLRERLPKLVNMDQVNESSGGNGSGNTGPMPGMQPMRRQTSLIVIDEAMEDLVLAEAMDSSFLKQRLASAESKAYNDPWVVASEAAVTSAIECLARDKDVERSYVSILSAIDILNRKKGVPEDNGSARQGAENGQTIRMAMDRECSTLLKIMIRSTIAHGLSKEVIHQGVISPNSLYLKLYNAMQNAGIQLQDIDHHRACQFLFDQYNTENALECLDRIDLPRWNSTTYRTAISCHLFSEPRHLYEAEVLFRRYLAHSRASYQRLLMDKSRPTFARQPQADQDEERAKRAMIKKWFKLQMDSSRWEEIKARYERRRTSLLLNTPGDIGRFSSFVGDQRLLRDQEAQRDRVSEQEQQRPAGIDEAEIPHSPCQAPEQPATTRRGFSFFSAFNFSKTRDTPPAKPVVRTTPLPIHISQPLSTGLTSPQISRQLTILHNSMLEECVNHKQFEYGWKQVYERMGPALEDRDTAKIAMRLCKRALLGHGDLEPQFPGSPNLFAGDMCFKDDYHEDVVDGRVDESQGDGRANDLDGRVGSNRMENRGETQPLRQMKQGNPEIWEARAWTIYNKAMMNYFFFTSAYASSGSPTQSPHPSSGHTANLYHQCRHGNAFSTTGDKSGSGTKLTSPTNVTAGMRALTVFLHNILTVAINSPEHSSRCLKALKIYDKMRNDPQNQYQSQLRDPFVMTCIIKIIYGTVLTVFKTLGQEHHQRGRTSTTTTSNSSDNQSSSAFRVPQSPVMTIGPLMDLAFEIYADMRNVGSIRDLPQLSVLVPPTSVCMTPTTPAPTGVMSLKSVAVSSLASENSSIISIFSQLSNRLHPSPSCSALDLPAYGIASLLTEAPSTSIMTDMVCTSNSATTSIVVPACIIPPSVQHRHYAPKDHNIILQELNPTLRPNLYTRRLPNELYLALLHLCIQVPLSGLEQSSRVLKTIVTDMMSTSPPGQQPANLDRHLAAALQVYHDRWMCRPKELEKRNPYDPRPLGHCDVNDDGELGNNRKGENESRGCSQKNMRAGNGGCVFHGWMYQSEEYVLDYMTPRAASSPTNTSTNELCDTTEYASSTVVMNTGGPSTSSSPCAQNSLLGKNSCTLAIADENESPYYGISKHDADLDELDQYLFERAFLADTESTSGGSNTGHSQWVDGLDQDTCNDRFYWNLWSREDPVLQEIRFSRRRARMLWRHVGSIEM